MQKHQAKFTYLRRDPEDQQLTGPEVCAFVEPEPVETVVAEQEFDLADYSPSLELLKEAGFMQVGAIVDPLLLTFYFIGVIYCRKLRPNP